MNVNAAMSSVTASGMMNMPMTMAMMAAMMVMTA